MRRRSLTLISVTLLMPAATMCQTVPVNPKTDATSVSPSNLAYVIVYVADMKRSVAFYRDRVRLKLKFTSPQWSEFDTGGTILALHPAGPKNPAGTSEVGITVTNLDAFYQSSTAAGVVFSGPPKAQSYGAPLTQMQDPDGALISVGGR